MSYIFPKVKLNKDGLFGPTANNNYYRPVAYHNKSAVENPDKTKWVLKQGQQYEVFRISDEGRWICEQNKGLFSILHNGDIILGSNEERLSFFPSPANALDAWHGYPVNSGEYEPSTKLVEKWVEDKIIDQRVSIKILKGQF